MEVVFVLSIHTVSSMITPQGIGYIHKVTLYECNKNNGTSSKFPGGSIPMVQLLYSIHDNIICDDRDVACFQNTSCTKNCGTVVDIFPSRHFQVPCHMSVTSQNDHAKRLWRRWQHAMIPKQFSLKTYPFHHRFTPSLTCE